MQRVRVSRSSGGDGCSFNWTHEVASGRRVRCPAGCTLLAGTGAEGLACTPGGEEATAEGIAAGAAGFESQAGIASEVVVQTGTKRLEGRLCFDLMFARTGCDATDAQLWLAFLPPPFE